jgi:hypothetical protein
VTANLSRLPNAGNCSKHYATNTIPNSEDDRHNVKKFRICA